MRVRDDCVSIVDRLVAEGKHDTYKDAFWYVYHVSRAKKTRCGFDDNQFERAYEHYRRWKQKTSHYSSAKQKADDYTDDF